MGKTTKKAAKKSATKKTAAPAKPKYEGGALKLDKKNLRVLYTVFANASIAGLSPEEVAVFTKAKNRVTKEYQKYQKTLPKDQRDSQ